MVRSDRGLWQLWCAGFGYIGEFAVSPQRLGGIRDVLQVQAGSPYVIALSADGTVWTWGNGYQKQLGELPIAVVPLRST